MRPIFLSIVFLYSFGGAMGQAPFFQNYFLLKKNEPVQVNIIFQDKAGFIWYGTNKGLFKYDGINLNRFTKADSLPDENVTAIAQDSLERIWTGHKNGQLAILEDDLITRFVTDEGAATGEVSDIIFDQHGNLWFSTKNDGLYYFIGGRLYRLDETDGMPDIFIYDLEEDHAGNIWAGTDGGAVICRLEEKKVNLEVINYDTGLPDNIVKKLAEGEDRTMWMGTEDAGIVNYDPVTRKVTPLLADASILGAVNDFLLNDQQIWLATARSGLGVYDFRRKKLTTYQTNSSMASVTCLLHDMEDNIWAGSKNGVVRSLGNYIEYITELDPAKDLNIVALAVDHQGNIWFSNSEGLFRRTVLPNGKIVVERPVLSSSFRNYKIISMFTDTRGSIWCGFYGEGALQINPLSGKVRYFNHELRNGNVLSISGKGDHVWLATLGGAARITVKGENIVVKNFSHDEGLISDYIYQIFIDSKDRVWFASDREGIDMLDGSSFYHFLDGLSSKAVYGFAEDGKGQMWANVQNEGLYKFDGKQFRTHSFERELNISCFSTGKSGNLLAVHDLGIDLYNIETDQVRHLDQEVGFGDRKPNLNALAKDQLGSIYIGVDNGVIIYSEMPPKSFTSPAPRIDALKVFNKNKELVSGLELAHNENNVTINFLGFWFQNPEGLNFQYRLENYDLDWISTRDRSAVYSSLPPGDYTFRVKVSASDDFSRANEAAIDFIVRPPFWRTTLFYIVGAVALVLFGYQFIRWRERTLQRDKMILEIKVNERTIEIQRMNEEIRAQTEEIKSINENLEKLVMERTSELEKKNKALEEYAFINAHSLRSPVASILGLINLLAMIDLDEDGKVMIAHLKMSAHKLDGVVRSITESIERGGQWGEFEEEELNE